MSNPRTAGSSYSLCRVHRQVIYVTNTQLKVLTYLSALISGVLTKHAHLPSKCDGNVPKTQHIAIIKRKIGFSLYSSDYA